MRQEGHLTVKYERDTILVKGEGCIAQLEDKEYKARIETYLHPQDTSISILCDKMKYDDGYYFLQQGGKNQTIWVFDSLGNYISKLGERGRKQNEYQTDITDWFYVKDKKEVFVYERYECRLHVFTIDGKPVESKFLASLPQSIGALKGDCLFCSYDDILSKDGIQLGLFNRDEEVIKDFINLNESMNFVPNNECFYASMNRLFHIPAFSDSSIVFHEDSVEKVVRFIFEDKFLTEDIKEEALDAKMDNFNKFDGIQFIKTYYETSRFHYLKYSYRNLFVNHLIDKKSKKQYSFASSPIKGLLPSTAMCVRGDKLLYLITKQNIEELRYLLDDRILGKAVSESNEIIQRIINGEESLPLILSIEFIE
jgi:hypothetical protein